MERLNFSITINKPKDLVWKILWDAETYSNWTKVFSENSYAVSDWEEGSKILFLGEGGAGMYSEIAKKKTGEIMSFRHLGMLKAGEEIPSDTDKQEWAGAMENYYLKEENGNTILNVELDITKEYRSYFLETFPKALDVIKKLSEA